MIATYDIIASQIETLLWNKIWSFLHYIKKIAWNVTAQEEKKDIFALYWRSLYLSTVLVITT